MGLPPSCGGVTSWLLIIERSVGTITEEHVPAVPGDATRLPVSEDFDAIRRRSLGLRVFSAWLFYTSRPVRVPSKSNLRPAVPKRWFGAGPFHRWVLRANGE